ncbi:MAG: hypothetical protein ABIY52_18580 [Gemmatimonadaceae bacterium]
MEIHCDRRNVASRRIPERLGYRVATVEGAPRELTVDRMDRDGFHRWPPAS